MAIGDPVCPICRSMCPCNCRKIMISLNETSEDKKERYYKACKIDGKDKSQVGKTIDTEVERFKNQPPEPHWKDKDGNEYVGVTIPLPIAGQVDKNGDVFTQEAIDSIIGNIRPCSIGHDGNIQWLDQRPAVYGPINQRLRDEKYQFPKETWTDPRPSWDTYFMSEAFHISRRSLDKHTKCGCVLVKDKRVVSGGYNSPPAGFIDSEADLERPGKYNVMEHAERNSVYNAARVGISTMGCTAYLTGFPCTECYRALWNAGIVEIIFAPLSLEYCTPDHITKLPAAKTGPKLTYFSKEKMKGVIKILDDTYDYIMEKVDFNTPDESPTS